MPSPEGKTGPGDELLRLARGSIEHGLRHSEPLPVRCTDLAEALAAPAATFTTLRLQGELRGCCGSLEPVHPLARDVTRSAFAAAFRDARFEPICGPELDLITLEVSVLSPVEPLIVRAEAELLAQLTPGRDGLVIVAGARRATFLPKVWESLPDARQFLDALKVKCGLAPDYWSQGLTFFRYHTNSYAEAA